MNARGMTMSLHDEAPSPNVYMQGNDNTDGRAASWAELDEANRLEAMDRFLEPFTSADLIPAFDRAQLINRVGLPIRLLDIGAGTGPTTESFTAMRGGEYWAYDVNAQLLDRRTTNPANKLYGNGHEIPASDSSFPITISRAVTAWNASTAEQAQAMIAEQLRVTGTVAVFSEFNWNLAGPTAGSDAFHSLGEAKDLVMVALFTGGFDPYYGSQMATDIDAVINQQHENMLRIETRHELPPGDYKDLFLQIARNVLGQLKIPAQKSRSAQIISVLLEECIDEIALANHCTVVPPTLITQTVHKLFPQ